MAANRQRRPELLSRTRGRVFEIPKRGGRTDVKQVLSDSERAHLLAMIQQPGYSVLLDIMELECIAQEMVTMNVPPSRHKEVLAQQTIGHAMWQFFKRVQDRLEREINELSVVPATRPVIGADFDKD